LKDVTPNSLPPARRIRRRAEYQRVFDAGRRAHGRYFTIVAAPAEGPLSRLGIVASRKVGGAVARNRAKRLIRQVFRTAPIPAVAADLIVIAKPAAAGAGATDVATDYRVTLKRLGLSK
jgi:ribonuclease P protein component